jgi:hypothetical protein
VSTVNTSEIVAINSDRVEELARTLGTLPLAPDFASQSAPAMSTSDETAFRSYLWAAAICHSTKGGMAGRFDGAFYKGWDYLLRAMCRNAEANSACVSPEFMLHITGDMLYDLLTAPAEDPQVSLPDLDRRAEILRQAAFELNESFNGHVSQLLKSAENHVEGPEGAYAQVSRLSAFRDPLRKKSSAFLMAVHFSGRWQIDDPEAVDPMIDYHRMRVLLRTGCLSLPSREIMRRLRDQQPVSMVIESALRSASMKVCKSLAVHAKMPMFDFDVLLWAHARSYCRNSPICVSGKPENASFDAYLAREPDRKCICQGWCPGAGNSEVRGLWEPIVATENY